MPKLPDASAFGARPTPQPNLGVVSISAGDEGAMNAPAAQVIKAGGDMEQAANQTFAANKEFEAKAKIEQHKLDTVRAEEAFNKLREHELDLQQGDDGYTKVKGINAISNPVLQTYSKRYADRVAELASTLTTDDQRTMFNARAQAAGVGYREGILRHLAAEGKVAGEQQWQATQTIEGRMITANWADDKVVASSIVRLEAGLKQQAQNNGWDPAYTEAMRQQVMGKVWDTVIDQAVANGNLNYAKEVYEQNKDQVAPATAKELAAKVVDADQRQRYNGYQSNFLALQDNAEGVKAWLGMVSQDPRLDEGKKNALIARGQSQLHVLATRAAAAQAHNDAVATRMLSTLNAQIYSGREFSTADIPYLQQMAKQFPERRGEISQAIGMAEEMARFRLLPPAMQQDSMNKDALGVRTGGVSDRLRDAKKAVFEAGQKQREADPSSWAVQQGVWAPTDLKAQSIDWSDPSKVNPNQVQARADGVRGLAMGATNYGVPFKPLTEPERQVAIATMAKMDAGQRLEYLKQTSRAYGGDVAAYRAHLAQIAPDQPVMAVAAIRARTGDADPRQATAAQIIADGLAIIEPNPKNDGKPTKGALVTQPHETKLRALFDDQVRNAYQWDANAASTTFQVARAAYAKLTEGSTQADRTVVDSDAWKKAMDIATGGVTKHNGAWVVKPWGMTDGDFSDKLDANLRALESTGKLPEGVTRGKLSDLPLIPRGDGIYEFQAGDQRIAGKDGKPLRIDLNKPLPAGMAPTIRSGADAKEREAATRARVQEARKAVQ